MRRWAKAPRSTRSSKSGRIYPTFGISGRRCLTANREELEWRAGKGLGGVASEELKGRVGGEFPLAEAAEAHRQLEGRLSTGKLLLIP